MEGNSPRLDVQIRLLTEDDLPFAVEVQKLASWNQVKSDWFSYLEYDSSGCFLAMAQGERAGTATAIRYDNCFGWVGMVLVHPAKRRLGIGTTLLKATIQYLQDSGIPCVKLDATPMGRKVYVTMGFQDEYDLNRYEGIAQTQILNSNEEWEIAPISDLQLNKIADFDKDYFGARRAQVISRLYTRGKVLCYYACDQNGATGYIMARDGLHAYHVGPWVAKDADTAHLLLQSVFEKIAGSKVFLDIPCPNGESAHLMESYGFTIQRPFTRMYLGPNDHPGIPENIFASSGAEKG
jgi:GNAT superfamily N-acetyltransferase